jgi:hypothetical protein
MGATTPYITFKNVQNGQIYTLSGYLAGADPVGYIWPVSGAAVATAGSPTDFVLPDGVWTIQHITGPATGKTRLWANGQPGPIAVDHASILAMAASGNTYGRFRGGSAFRYSLVVESPLAA